MALGRRRIAMGSKPGRPEVTVASERGIRRCLEPCLAAVCLLAMVTCAKLGAPAASPATRGALATAARAPASAAPAALSSEQSQPPALESTPSAAPSDCSAALTGWRRAVERYEQGAADTKLRILWFGDSHAAADYWPGTVRRELSRMVPLSGPGFITLAASGYRHSMMRVWHEGEVELSPHPPARRSRESDGVFGLGGTRVALGAPPAAVFLLPTGEGTVGEIINYELWFRPTSDSDRLLIVAGGATTEARPSPGESSIGGISRVRFSAARDNRIEFRAARGKPQLFGVVAETGHSGLIVDTLGINGARFGTFLAWEPEAFSAAVATRAPTLAVVAYGTNEVYDEEAVSRHAERLKQVVGRLRATAPGVDCLVVGPTDVTKGGQAAAARVKELDIAERLAAGEIGCAYFSPYETMQAEGGYNGWGRLQPALALADGVHLTARGYTRLGERLVERCLLGGLRR